MSSGRSLTREALSRRGLVLALTSARALGLVLVLVLVLGGCGNALDVGSDLLWRALFETGDFSEWTNAHGSVQAFPAPSSVEITREQAHHGDTAAKLTVTTSTDGNQVNALLSRTTGLPAEAYYSAWYYLPRQVTVSSYWVIFKLRFRASVDDEASEGELYDVNLRNLPTGEMSLRLYDHRTGDVSLPGTPPVVPVGAWFELEAFYRNASDDRGRLTLWLDGKEIVDVTNTPMSHNAWVGWTAASVAVDLTPSTAVLFVDDCAVSRTRVGPQGQLGPP